MAELPFMSPVAAPAHWASALINGDRSSLSREEALALSTWLDEQGLIDADFVGTTGEKHFTWNFARYGIRSEVGFGLVEGGEVMLFQMLRPRQDRRSTDG